MYKKHKKDSNNNLEKAIVLNNFLAIKTVLHELFIGRKIS
tara:strand:+ start:75 stop:194 length:120 start_codon:yes stop_codon:yes gene_type:complete